MNYIYTHSQHLLIQQRPLNANSIAQEQCSSERADSQLESTVDHVNDVIASVGRPTSTSLGHDTRDLHILHDPFWLFDDHVGEAGAKMPGNVAVKGPDAGIYLQSDQCNSKKLGEGQYTYCLGSTG